MSLLHTARRLHRRARRADRGARVRPLPRRAPVQRQGAALLRRLRPAARHLARAARTRTEWVIAAIPFGGYVKMLDEREAPVEPRGTGARLQPAERRQAAAHRRGRPGLQFPVRHRGLRRAVHGTACPRRGRSWPSRRAATLARAAGFRAGDTVRAIDGQPVATWQDLRWRVLQAALQRQQIGVEVIDARDRHLGAGARPERLSVRGGGERRDGAPRPAAVPAGACRRCSARSSRAAPRSARDSPPATASRMPTAARSPPGTTWCRRCASGRNAVLQLTVERGGAVLSVQVTPDAVGTGSARIGRIGAAPEVSADARRAHLRARAARTARQRRQGGRQDLGHLGVQPARCWARCCSARCPGSTCRDRSRSPTSPASRRSMGWIPYLTFLALISISLGVLNLLPIPPLDGGHLMYYAIELLKGSPGVRARHGARAARRASRCCWC